MFTRVSHTQPHNPRKRRKTTHVADERALQLEHAMAHNMTTAINPAQPVQTVVTMGDVIHASTYADAAAMHRLEPDLEAMKSLITCKICQRYLTEPYTLGCGHTYCYICLESWLVGQNKHNCPECRQHVEDEPVPSFIVKEMVSIFSSREELLPRGDSMEYVRASAKEAADKVASDRANNSHGLLFAGFFAPGQKRNPRPSPFRDEEDGIYRCPRCMHEVEDGMCSNPQCIHYSDGYSTDDENDEDDDDQNIQNAYLDRSDIPYGDDLEEDDDDEDDSDDEDDPEMDGFVVPDDGHAYELSDYSSGHTTERALGLIPAGRRRRANRPVVIDSDTDYWTSENEAAAPLATARQNTAVGAQRNQYDPDGSGDDSEDGDIAPTTAPPQRGRNKRRVLSDSSEPEDESDDSDGNGDSNSQSSGDHEDDNDDGESFSSEIAEAFHDAEEGYNEAMYYLDHGYDDDYSS